MVGEEVKDLGRVMDRHRCIARETSESAYSMEDWEDRDSRRWE